MSLTKSPGILTLSLDTVRQWNAPRETTEEISEPHEVFVVVAGFDAVLKRIASRLERS